ncbi:MAG TPA: hypothetical protein VHS31_09600 [Tepidisphaeraceae bacterium]|nr:hypothetical protein [Tepidisphaeraceae bacterium]
MSDKWMTVAAAAANLDVHPRTIERRIASQKIQSRRADDGQVQVLVNVPDEMPRQDEAFETVKELAQDQVSLATGSASALVKFAQVDAERARIELGVAREDAGRARQSAKFAWVAVAAMAAAICIAVGWTTHYITRSNDDVRILTSQADAIRRDADEMRKQRDVAVKEAEEAKIARAEVAGHLEAVANVSGKSPTTKPTTVFQRMASVFFEP